MRDEFSASFEVLLKDETFKEGVGKVIQHFDKMNQSLAQLQEGFNFFSSSALKSFGGLHKTLGSFSRNTRVSLDAVTNKLNSFSNLDFSSGFLRQGDALGMQLDLFGNKADDSSYKLYRFRETALRSFRELVRPISDFTKQALNESGAIQNSFARLTMFLDSSSVSSKFIVKADTKDAEGNLLNLIKRGEALSRIQKDILDFTLGNPFKNISYLDAVKSYGTFLSGNMEMSSALVGLDMLAHADKIFPEISKDDMTNYLVNSYNQIKAFYKTHGSRYGVGEEEVSPRTIMERTMNTMSMVSNKYKFNLPKGETPYKALAKSLTTNNLGAGFTLEELGVLAGTMTSAGVSASETDTSINNFLMRLARAKKKWRTDFKKDTGEDMNLVETLSYIHQMSRAEHKDKDLRDVISDLMQIFTIRGAKSVAISIPNLDEMSSQIKSITLENEKDMGINSNEFRKRFQENADIMNRTFASSKKAFSTVVADFQTGYGNIARGFQWMTFDIGTGFIDFVNKMRASENIFVKLFGGGITMTAGVLGSFISMFSDIAPMIIAITGIYYNKGSIKGMFSDIGKALGAAGRGVGGLLKGLFIFNKSNSLLSMFIGLKNVVWGFGKGLVSVFTGFLPSAIKMGISGIVLFAKTTLAAFTGIASVIPNMAKMFNLFFLSIGENARSIYKYVSDKVIKMAVALTASKFGIVGAGLAGLYLGLDSIGALDSVKESLGSLFDGLIGKAGEFSGKVGESLKEGFGTVKDWTLEKGSYFSDLLGLSDLVGLATGDFTKKLDDTSTAFGNLAKGVGGGGEVYALGYSRLSSLSNLTSALKVGVEKNVDTGIKVVSVENGLNDLALIRSLIEKIQVFVKNIDINVLSIKENMNASKDISQSDSVLLDQMRSAYLFGNVLDG
ncbi:phage tail tape measure protein [Borrelia sp. RT1S]|uniref:phage tail tape measure protein n=1 Tax=Borrelia sp. RT1S TaxID=2898580 RepID=UPI001E2C2925|nr:phage tail tape measure protein [Borrelia sp. RT1S]UGQ17881.1 phage tail tape measure protein [Borrelia sp. RT1S]